MLTLTGPGGVGKSRLALQLAEQSRRAFTDGVGLVELADLQQGDLVAQSVASVFGLRDETSRPVERLADYLRDKHVLLIMDNCEHLVEACAVLISKLLAAAPQVRVLATSRHVLGTEGEQVLRVPPLSLPADEDRQLGEQQVGTDAVTLFAERATAADSTFQVTEANRDAVIALCQRLEGMPLALELAAARLRAVDIEQVLARLDDALGLLTTGQRTVPPRQQTLEATVAWSYHLCSPGEQHLWNQLSIFSGGFTLDAAEHICRVPDDEQHGVFDLLSGLVDKSIVQRSHPTNDQPMRYTLPEVLRQFGHTQLAASGDENAVRSRHRDYFAELASRGEQDYCSSRDLDWFRQVHREHANLRAALDFSLTQPEQAPTTLTIAMQLRPFWLHSGYNHEGYRWLCTALEHATAATPLRARALSTASLLAALLSETDKAKYLLAESRQLTSQIRADEAAAEATLASALLAFADGDSDEALRLARLAAQRCRAAGIQGVATESLSAATVFALGIDDPTAGELAQELLSLTTSQEAHLLKALALWLVGLAHWRENNQQAAQEHLGQALELFTQSEQPLVIAHCLDGLAWSAASSGDYYRAARLMGAARTRWKRNHLSLAHAMTARFGADRQHFVRAALGDSAFNAAFDRGANSTLEEIINYALGKRAPESQQTAPSAASALLTTRETEIAEHVAHGLSNKEIASKLVISTRTVDTHVDHILHKLGVHSRTQIAMWISDHKGLS
ncbi:LuxR C-terminal-related transcriptional regulator [Haloechinothrix aidingensis]|uniref:LuxR C-terminal-related transcriptional regulator n=1 Tax=Haloechinothrix aidingensis TaxID=2752311 RepID=UPI001C60ADA3|nr:LuxR C-terminal-related transcriptional regulator [Haloechinothrix aidingensis]